MTLPPGTPVEQIKTEAEWAQVAHNGEVLGYVATKHLKPIR